MSAYHVDSLELSSGGVPRGPIFQMEVEDLRRLAKRSSKTGRDAVRELCLIGLLSYFEAFCKDLFASCVNICPEIIERLEQRGLDTSIDARRALDFENTITRRLGFLLAEKYDFGSARQINAHFTALLLLTPFGKKESVAHDQLLADRNLMVHHGGVFTSSYASQRLEKIKIKSAVYYDSLIMDRRTLLSHVRFLEATALKMLTRSHVRMLEFVSQAGVKLDEETRKAIDYLQWYE
jgi:hypothetical protein